MSAQFERTFYFKQLPTIFLWRISWFSQSTSLLVDSSNAERTNKQLAKTLFVVNAYPNTLGIPKWYEYIYSLLWCIPNIRIC